MESKEQELTPRQQAYFEHVWQAKEQGLTLTAYCQKQGLNVRSLYDVRRGLVEKGVLPRTLPPKAKQPHRSTFVAVQVALSSAGVGEPVCRVRHPSGWTIECSGWPEAGWMSALVQGGRDASA